MIKESVNKFDLEAAFKALNEVEIPMVKGIRPNRENLQEKFTKKLVTDILVEDYFNVNDSDELEQAQSEREAEIAKAKLARIEKIVDLDAETEEDLLPSYVGKLIMQCPQCMTLFYKNEKDIEKSEENPEVVNLNEPCQHCGNSSGYTLIGKVGTVGEEEAAQYDTTDFEEDEFNLDFDETEETAEDTEETSEESTEEAATEGEEDLAPIEETEEEEEVKESLNEDVDLNLDPAIAARFTKSQLAKLTPEEIKILQNPGEHEARNKIIAKYNAEESLNEDVVLKNTDQVCSVVLGDKQVFTGTKEECEDYIKTHEGAASKAKGGFRLLDTAEVYVEESLTEDIDLNKQLDLYNDFIKYLQKMVEQDEDALEEAKKLGNKEVIAAIEKRLENSKAELKAALPTTVKDEVTAEELPTPEETGMENATENKKEEEDKKEEKKESLTEDVDTERKLDAEEAALEKTNVEEVVIEAANSDVVRALDKLEAELTEEAKITEAKFDVSDADFRAMLKNPVFNEACKKELEEDLPPVNDAAFEKAADAIEAAGSELTPEEQKLEDEELATNVEVEESLTESTDDLLTDNGTLAILIYPDRLDAETRKEKLLADPDFVKALEAFAQNYNMIAKPEDLEDGISPVEDMYDCAFEGIEGEDFEDTLDELISYYIDIKAKGDLNEAASQGGFSSQLKRNYAITEIIAKELKAHPLFSNLSIRTIQRILLPYYKEYAGEKNETLSAQAVIDFFEFEGFATYVLDHFAEMDPLARKELLKADAKFMEIFDAWAKEFGTYPAGGENIQDEAKTPFDYAFNIIFDCQGDDGVVQYTQGTRDAIAAFKVMYVNGKFDRAIAEKVIDKLDHSGPWVLVDDLDEKSFDTLTEKYLTEVYSNVKSFEATSCSLDDGKLVIEGKINFNSGKTKTTTFTYEATKTAEGKVILEGLNADFATEKAFVLSCSVDKANCLIVESLNYKYAINETLVEGLIK